MPTIRTQFTVGLFVTVGILIGIVAFVWLGASRYLERGRLYSAYFDESVQGLIKDSPVKYRGVTVGRVASIDVAPDSRLIRVLMEIEQAYSLDVNTAAQLKAVGITGAMFIELDIASEKDKELSPRLSFPSEYPVVPSKPSEIRLILEGVDDLMKQFKSLDLKGISEKTRALLDSAGKTIADANIKELSEALRKSVDRFNAFAASDAWDKIPASLEKASEELKNITAKASETVDSAKRTASQIEKTAVDTAPDLKEAMLKTRKAASDAAALFLEARAAVKGSGKSVAEITERLAPVLEGLESTVERLKELVERLSDNPSGILFRNAPAPSKPEELF